MRRDNPPSREERQAPTAFTSSSFGGYSEGTGTLRAAGGDLGGGSETLITSTNRLVAFGEYSDDGTASTIKARDYKDATDLITVYETHPADSRVKEMGEVCQTVTSRWGTGGGNVPIAATYCIQGSMIGRSDTAGPQGSGINEEVSFTLNTTDRHATAFKIRGGCDGGGKGYLGNDETAFTISTVQDQQLFTDMRVRRLTPTECERLQGFPDEIGRAHV